jgi:hypothetical protein
MKRLWLGLFSLGITLLFAGTSVVLAAQTSSPHYELNEVEFGAGGQLNASSPHYQAQQNLGPTTTGTFKSASYWAEAGYLTPNVPFLQMSVTPANINLGDLNTASAATGTATFSVRAYTDSGYVVETMNDPPVQEDGKTLHALLSPTASQAGTEQFGINLVQNLTTCANPAPANFGTNPVPIPNSSYATGQAASGYNTCGLFKYSKGDVIAETSSNGWGETDYTISYIANISTVTYAGKYNMTQDLVAVATY